MLPDIGNGRQPKPEHIYLPLGLQETHAHSPCPRETEQSRSMQLRKMTYEKWVCNLSWAGQL